jgi:hypothetical protein
MGIQLIEENEVNPLKIINHSCIVNILLLVFPHRGVASDQNRAQSSGMGKILYGLSGFLIQVQFSETTQFDWI